MKKFSVIGFPKCATMSMVDYIRKIHPGAEVTRPENIYTEEQGFHLVKKWHEWECIVITRDPVKRIQSCMSYFTEFRNLTVEDVYKGVFDRYENIGCKWPIYQSNYDLFIKKWEKKHGQRLKVYKFEDMIKDKDFPHINETDYKRKFTKRETDYIKGKLEEAGVSY